MSQYSYCAFFRGINVGGNKRVPMAQVSALFKRLGFTAVSTLLNSGNVVFSTANANGQSLAETIQNAMKEEFGFEVPTIIRSKKQIEKIIEATPFSGVKITKDTRLYVTLIRQEVVPPLIVPWSSEDGAFSILSANQTEIASVLDVAKTGTTEAMKILEQKWGHDITTRNWNTIEKVWERMCG